MIASVTPSVLAAGGDGLHLSGLILTNNPRVAVGTVPSFPSRASVETYFGALSQEAQLAGRYFLGFDNSSIKPGALMFAQYPTAAVGGWLRGGSVAGLSIAQLQAISGTLSVTIDGVVKTAAALTLATSTSFSLAAIAIQTGLAIQGPLAGTITGSIATTVLTVTVASGITLAPGQTLVGGTISAGTTILAQLTGAAGGTGTYTVNNSQTQASISITVNNPAVVYDAIAGAFQINSATTGAASSVTAASGSTAAALGLTTETGAVTSGGAIAATPATAMAAITNVSMNWCSFMTAFKPDVSGNTNAMAFTAWTNLQNNRFVYACWDNDITATASNNTTSIGALLKANNASGTMPIYAPVNGADMAAFVMGAIASINFEETQGRATLAFRSQTGFAADVTDYATAQNLVANGYNYYGVWGTANDTFIFLYPGLISGPYEWADSYVNQIWLSNQLQLDMMVLMTQLKSLPYNALGYSIVRSSIQDTINQAKDFGAFQGGVTLSQLQVSEVNTTAGIRIDKTLSSQGWYVQVKDATPQVRQNRASPPFHLWYMDGQSIQQLNIASVEVM
jgi:hypothetical protein